MWLAAEVTEPYSRNLPLNEAGDPERASLQLCLRHMHCIAVSRIRVNKNKC